MATRAPCASSSVHRRAARPRRMRAMRRRAPEPEVRVAHQDEHLLVVIKPPGLPTTSPDPEGECLAAIVRRLEPRAQRMHATSRLDRDVTGLVTFAKTDRA